MTTILFGKIAWCVLVVGWYVIRYPFERRARRAEVAKTSRGPAETLRMAISFTGLGLVPAISVATGFPRFARYDPSVVQIVLGVAAMAATFALFRLTHKALGKMWSVSLDIREKHKLITTGIYRRLRHPMYSAFWMLAVSQALLVPNLVGGLAGLLGFGILFFARIGPEERMMEERFGEEYRLYRSRTARIVPGIF